LGVDLPSLTEEKKIILEDVIVNNYKNVDLKEQKIPEPWKKFVIDHETIQLRLNDRYDQDKFLIQINSKSFKIRSSYYGWGITDNMELKCQTLQEVFKRYSDATTCIGVQETTPGSVPHRLTKSTDLKGRKVPTFTVLAFRYQYHSNIIVSKICLVTMLPEKKSESEKKFN